jgi:hypothetical protein
MIHRTKITILLTIATLTHPILNPKIVSRGFLTPFLMKRMRTENSFHCQAPKTRAPIF